MAKDQETRDYVSVVKRAHDRHKAGAIKYGSSFRKKAPWRLRQDMREELLDMINYAVYTILKLDEMDKADDQG